MVNKKVEHAARSIIAAAEELADPETEGSGWSQLTLIRLEMGEVQRQLEKRDNSTEGPSNG